MGFSLIIVNPKHCNNVGQMMRTAELFGVENIVIVNPERVGKKSYYTGDTSKTPTVNKMFADSLGEGISLCKKTYRDDAEVVAVELTENAYPLNTFSHADNSIYVMGAEDVGLSQEQINLCDKAVVIPIGQWSHNVAQAATMVMYDRWVKANG